MKPQSLLGKRRDAGDIESTQHNPLHSTGEGFVLSRSVQVGYKASDDGTSSP